jgi:hypothetical protein
MYGNAKEGLDDSLFVQKVSIFFQNVSSWWDLLTNCHLLILDGHGFRGTLQAIE